MLSIRQFLPLFIRTNKPEKERFIEFKGKLNELYSETINNPSQGEEFQKGLLKEFIKSLFRENKINTYKNGNWANVDLCVYNDNGEPAIIFESKSTANLSEMIDAEASDGFNRKALHEVILYYLDIKISQGLNSVKTLVITNNIDWIVIDSIALDSIAINNPKIRKLYSNFNEQKNGLNKPKSADFYNAIKRYFQENYNELENFKEKCVAFSINQKTISLDEKCIWYQRLLSEECLLKKRHDIANVLDKGFYDELLYIIGLKEESASKKIVRLDENDRQDNSILEQLIELLINKGVSSEKIFEIALELSITWINRILFIKLLEAQLINWHPNESDKYKILSTDLIQGYDWLNMLFFSALAKPNNERSRRVERFSNVPYLNSSLFEETDTEKQLGITVSNLIDGSLTIYSKTILRNEHGRHYDKQYKIDALEYLFRFLDSYDFGLEYADDLFLSHSKTIINPSVLGLIFEKINGYKDGSYFTPSHVTFYMAKSTLTKTILEKFSSNYHENFSTFSDIANYIGLEKTKKNEAKTILESIRICDPASGSGHFLVSALNVMFDVYYKLRLIYTDNGELLNNFVNIDVDEDETYITDENDRQFVYVPNNKTSQLVQKAIFETKKSIIESSLFGVDINEKSVQICRLRLWIELLKHAYYTRANGNELLQTMPNIDINIKKGNSLINRYEISVGQAAKSLPTDLNDARRLINEYRQAVKNYRNDANKLTKQKLNYTIDQIKLLLGVNRQLSLDFGDGTNISKKDNSILTQAFEWMLEFPEALDDNGKFTGFDAILVNPPYIDSEAMKNHLQKEREYYREKFTTTRGNWDIYISFIERCYQLLSKNGYCSCITPDKWLTKDFGSTLRSFVAPHIRSVVRFGRDVFENALVDAIVSEFSYKKSSYCSFGQYTKGLVTELNKVKTSNLTSTYDYHFNRSETLNLGEQISRKLSSLAKCEGACATSDCYLLANILDDDMTCNHAYKLVNTGTVTKFGNLWGKKPITYLKRKMLHPVINIDKFESLFLDKAYDIKTKSPKIIIKGLTKLDGMIDLHGQYVPGKSTVVVYSDNVRLLKMLAAFINSSFAISYLLKRFPSATYNGGLTFNGDIIGTIPIPLLTTEQEDYIVRLVDDILVLGKGFNDERLNKLDEYISSIYGWNSQMS